MLVIWFISKCNNLRRRKFLKLLLEIDEILLLSNKKADQVSEQVNQGKVLKPT